MDKYLMRQWLDLFEDFDDDVDDAEGDRLSAIYARERHVTNLVGALCQKLGLDVSQMQHAINYNEEDNRQCAIYVDDHVTLEQLSAFTQLGDQIKVGGYQEFQTLITFRVSPKLDPTPKLKRM
jgi:hypothetical protein